MPAAHDTRATGSSRAHCRHDDVFIAPPIIACLIPTYTLMPHDALLSPSEPGAVCLFCLRAARPCFRLPDAACLPDARGAVRAISVALCASRLLRHLLFMRMLFICAAMAFAIMLYAIGALP